MKNAWTACAAPSAPMMTSARVGQFAKAVSVWAGVALTPSVPQQTPASTGSAWTYALVQLLVELVPSAMLSIINHSARVQSSTPEILALAANTWSASSMWTVQPLRFARTTSVKRVVVRTATARIVKVALVCSASIPACSQMFAEKELTVKRSIINQSALVQLTTRATQRFVVG